MRRGGDNLSPSPVMGAACATIAQGARIGAIDQIARIRRTGLVEHEVRSVRKAGLAMAPAPQTIQPFR